MATNIEFWDSLDSDGAHRGKIAAYIHRETDCIYTDMGHDFGMVESVAVEKDTNLAFYLKCGCIIALEDPFDAHIIQVKE